MENKNCVVVFHILSTNSYLNASFKIANELKLRNYRVVYFASLNDKDNVISKGFEYFPFPLYNFSENNKNRTEKSFFRKFLFQYKAKLYYKNNYLKGNFYDELLRLISPDLVIVDLSYIYYSIFLLKKEVPFIILCTKVSLNSSNLAPPFTSDYIPKGKSKYSNMYVLIQWIFRVIYNIIMEDIKHIRVDKVSHFHLMLEYKNINKLKLRELINGKRSSHFGWKHIPELILSPRSFDFPRKFPSNQFHIGPIVDVNRTENVDTGVTSLISHLINESSMGKKIVYCSFGNYEFCDYSGTLFGNCYRKLFYSKLF